MDESRAKKLVEAVIAGSNSLSVIAATALRNRKPLTGSGYYGEKFHDGVVKFAKLHAALRPLVSAINGLDPGPLEKHITTITSVSAKAAERDEARKQLRLLLETSVLPKIGNLSSPATPASQSVLPSAVLSTAPTYLQRTLLQANGCYEQRWFDACSVMIRKLVENLIIDVYEKHGKQDEVKKDGNYLMLSGLVTAILSQTHWQLQRETKRELPQIKTLGDRAAHNRRYQATRQDVDQVKTGLRAAVDDLLHLAGYK